MQPSPSQFQYKSDTILEEMSRLHDQIQDVEVENGKVFAKKAISKGTKYGPFIGKLTSEPNDPRFAWEVSAETPSFSHTKFLACVDD